jgi:hypothetical protein
MQHYMPPVQYDYEPKEPYQIVTVSTDTVKMACRMDSLSCAKPFRHQIIISKDVTGEFREILLRHEKAHLNGWIHAATDAEDE